MFLFIQSNRVLSHARTQYISSGSINVSQKTIYMLPEYYISTHLQVGAPRSSGTIIYDRWQDGVPGAFVTKVEVFMRKAPQTANSGGNDLAIPLQLQIREVEAGVPKRSPPGDQFRVYLACR